jgi:hypothetical protein
MIGVIARIAEMIAGTAGMTVGIAGMIATVITAETNRKAIATDWIGDEKTRGTADHSTRIIPVIFEMAILLIAKASAEGIPKATANLVIHAGGN